MHHLFMFACYYGKYVAMREVIRMTDRDLMDIIQYLIEAKKADGCNGCAFEDYEEWYMPCDKCKRNCKDYWRPKTHDID